MSNSRSLSFSVLGLRGFRLLLITRTFIMMSMQAQAVVVGWQIYSLTQDFFLLGLTGLAEAVPAISCALFAGHFVDSHKPRSVYLLALAALSLNTLMLCAVGGGFIPLGPSHLLPWIYAGIFMSGIARSFLMPASFSLLPQIVPRADISAASAWTSSGIQAATIIGPAIAGIIYGGYGARMAWFLPAFLICSSFFMAFFIRPTIAAAARKREPALKSIREGWMFIWKNQILLAAMALDMMAVLFGGAVAMLPAYADQVLHVGSEGLGLLRGAPALGAIAAALALAVRPMKKIRAALLLWVVAGFGVSMIGFGLSTVFWLSVVFLTLSGIFDSINMVIRGVLMQLLTPDHMRGRVSSVSSMFIVSSNELGAFESGTLARMIGLVPSVVIGGIGTLVVVAATAMFSPQLRRTVVEADKT